jgi:hypothetical protein
MTVVISVKSQDGAVLVADALVIDGNDRKTHQKIECGLNTERVNQRDHLEHPHISGVYSAWSGSFASEYHPPFFLNRLRIKPNLADALTDEYVLTHSIDQINEERDRLHQRWSGHPFGDERDSIGTRIQYLDELVTVKAFIEQRGISQRDLSLLRLSDNFSPDLLYVSDSQVETIEGYHTHGSGSELVEPTLEEGYRPDLTLDQATNLAIAAMNKALEKKDEFRGFHLVRTKRLDSGIDLVETAFDFNANYIDHKQIRYLGPQFS